MSQSIFDNFKSRAKVKLQNMPIAWTTLRHAKEANLVQSLLAARLLRTNNGYIVSASTLGISNRIKCLLSSMRLCQLQRMPLALYWPRNWACRCDFNDLFENKIPLLDKIAVDKVKEGAVSSSNNIVIDTWRMLVLRGEITDEQCRSVNVGQSNFIDFCYNDIPSNIRESYLTYVRQLEPVEYIRTKVDSFLTYFDASTVSVSIRSWPEAKERAESLFRIANVFARMDEFPDASFFISCDSIEVLDSIEKRYKDRVITYPKRTLVNDRVSRDGMQDIIIDMLLLSKNTHLIASCFSTFPEVAWWLGGCNATVQFIEDEETIRSWAEQHPGDRTEIIPFGVLDDIHA